LNQFNYERLIYKIFICPNIVRLRAMAVGPNSLLIVKHAEREAVENISELQPIRSLANAKELMEQNDLI
jgi:hypothetical protein